MAKRETNEADQRFPEWWRRKSLRGFAYEQNWRGIKVLRGWPKPKGPARTPGEQEQERLFTVMAKAQMNAWTVDRVGAEAIATGSQYVWRDVLGRALVGKLIEFEPVTGDVFDMVDVQGVLDQITTEKGAMLMRTDTQWVALMNPTGEPFVIWDDVNEMPVWGDPGPQGIFELHGDVLAGPGIGNQLATLAASGVTPGTYTLATITVDIKGRITAASTGSVSAGINQLTGDVTAGPGSGSQAATLANSGVSAGSYTLANITVDAKGRVTSAANGSAPAYINQLTGDVTAGPGSGSQAATLANTGVVAGTYTYSTVSVDAKGRVTGASNGAAPSGGVPSTSSTWTPTDQSGAGLTLTVTDAYYINTGSMVLAWARITYPTTSNTSQARISLPVACRSLANSLTAGYVTGNFTHGDYTAQLQVLAASLSRVQLQWNADFGPTIIQNSELTGHTINLFLMYPSA